MGFPFLTLQSDILRTGSDFPASQISSTVHLSSHFIWVRETQPWQCKRWAKGLWLTLICPSLFERIWRPGHICPPYAFKVWFGLGFQIFLEITCLGMIYHFQKDSWSLDDKNTPRQWWTLFNFSLVGEASDLVRKVNPYEILVIPTNFVLFSAKWDDCTG